MSLGEATFEMTQIAMGEAVQREQDKKLLVVFSRRPHQNHVRSAEEGRPIYEEKDYVTIMVPGDKDTVIERVATEMDIARFSDRYEAFRRKQNQETVAGTPLAAVSFISRAQVKELEYFNIHTVEQLAELSDSNSQKFMGIQKLKQLAKDFLKAATEQAPLTSMRAEMEKKDEQIAALLKAVEDQGNRIKALEAAAAEED